MKFDEAIKSTRTLTELRRIAGAHVVDNRQLEDSELRQAVIKVKPQYFHEDTVRTNLFYCFFQDPYNDRRVLSRLLIADVLLDQ